MRINRPIDGISYSVKSSIREHHIQAKGQVVYISKIWLKYKKLIKLGINKEDMMGEGNRERAVAASTENPYQLDRWGNILRSISIQHFPYFPPLFSPANTVSLWKNILSVHLYIHINHLNKHNRIEHVKNSIEPIDLIY